MTILKSISKISAAAVVLSLFSSLGAKAGDISFDDAGRPGLSVSELKDQTKDDYSVPTPSPYTPTSELNNFWDNLTENTLDKLCKAANIRVNEGANIIPQLGIEGGLRREFKSYPDKRLALIDEIKLKLSASLGTEVLNIPNAGPINV